MATLHLKITTPEGVAFTGDVDSVLLPSVEGDMGVLPQHETTVTELAPGELQIVQKGKLQSLAVGEGFAEVTPTSVSVLTDGAIEAEKIDETAVETAVKRAEELLKSNTLEGEELEATQASLVRSLAQLHVHRRRRPQ